MATEGAAAVVPNARAEVARLLQQGHRPNVSPRMLPVAKPDAPALQSPRVVLRPVEHQTRRPARSRPGGPGGTSRVPCRRPPRGRTRPATVDQGAGHAEVFPGGTATSRACGLTAVREVPLLGGEPVDHLPGRAGLPPSSRPTQCHGVDHSGMPRLRTRKHGAAKLNRTGVGASEHPAAGSSLRQTPRVLIMGGNGWLSRPSVEPLWRLWRPTPFSSSSRT